MKIGSKATIVSPSGFFHPAHTAYLEICRRNIAYYIEMVVHHSNRGNAFTVHQSQSLTQRPICTVVIVSIEPIKDKKKKKKKNSLN